MPHANLDQLRQAIAQEAARMIAEEGIHDFAYAKKKAGRQLGISDNSALPTNVEIENEVKLYHEIYNADEQPIILATLRKAALATMQLLQKFNPHLTGTVLDGTAGKFSQTDIHLFADNEKEIEIFLLNQHIPYKSSEKTFRLSNKPSKDKKNRVRKTVPTFTLETEFGLQKLSVFNIDDMRTATKRASNGSNANRADIAGLIALIQ